MGALPSKLPKPKKRAHAARIEPSWRYGRVLAACMLQLCLFEVWARALS
jgi:hypothetical protein